MAPMRVAVGVDRACTWPQLAPQYLQQLSLRECPGDVPDVMECRGGDYHCGVRRR